MADRKLTEDQNGSGGVEPVDAMDTSNEQQGSPASASSSSADVAAQGLAAAAAVSGGQQQGPHKFTTRLLPPLKDGSFLACELCGVGNRQQFDAHCPKNVGRGGARQAQQPAPHAMDTSGDSSSSKKRRRDEDDDDENGSPHSKKARADMVAQRKKVKARMERFVEWCRAPRNRSPVSFDEIPAAVKKAFDSGLSRVTELMIEEEKGSVLLEAHIAPEPWPLFTADKQSEILGDHILFRRIRKPYPASFDKIVELLKKGKVVCVLGTRGCAKSASTNVYLSHFLQHIGEQGYPPVVALRVDNFVTTFRRFPSGQLDVSVDDIHRGAETAMIDLNMISESLAVEKGVLLVELRESEKNLHVKPGCGLLFSVSNRNAREEFEELSVPGKLNFFLYDPWTDDEIESATRVLYCVDGFAAALGVNGGLKEVLEEVRRRTVKVGPLMRWVLCTMEMFQQRVDAQNAVEPDVFWEDVRRNSVFEIRKNASLFLVPFVREDAPFSGVSKDHFCWKFLSQLCGFRATMMADTVPESVRTFYRFRLEHYAHEDVMIYALLQHPELAPKFQCENWDWFSDPGPDKLSLASLRDGPPESFKLPESSASFDGRYACFDATKKSYACLCAANWQMVLCEAFTVNHAAKVAYLLQSSKLRPPDHEFFESQIETFRANTNLPDDFTLAFVYVMDQSNFKDGLGGMRVVSKSEAKKPKSTRIKKPLTDFPHVKGYIVRALLTPGVPEKPLPLSLSDAAKISPQRLRLLSVQNLQYILESGDLTSSTAPKFDLVNRILNHQGRPLLVAK